MTAAQILTGVVGFSAIVDHWEVNGIAWVREDWSPPETE
jgi:hypothetical protein